MPLVFQYGSNCDIERLNSADRLNGGAEDLGRVQTVDEYEIAFNKWTTRHDAAADLLKPRKGGRRIWGVLYKVSSANFKKLIEDIEGPSYRPQSIVVQRKNRATQTVKTFRVRQARRQDNRHTSAEYVGHIVRGLRTHAVPENYVQHVIDVAIQANLRATATAIAAEQNRLIEAFRTLHQKIVVFQVPDSLRRPGTAYPGAIRHRH